MAKRKTKTTPLEITVEAIISAKIAELESQPCTCAILLNEVGEPVKIKCGRCEEIERWKNKCVCGKCDDCLVLLLEYYQLQACECTYKTIQVEEIIINPDTGLEETVMVDKEVVDVQCDRCKKIDSINKALSDRDIMTKAYIDEEDFDKYEVVDGVIVSKEVDKGKPSDIDVLKNESSNILSSTLDIDFRLMEVETIIMDSTQSVSTNYNLLKNVKGSGNMTPYEMMYTLILADNYERADFEYKIPVYVKRGRMTQEEADKLAAMMDAKEFVPIK